MTLKASNLVSYYLILVLITIISKVFFIGTAFASEKLPTTSSKLSTQIANTKPTTLKIDDKITTGGVKVSTLPTTDTSTSKLNIAPSINISPSPPLPTINLISNYQANEIQLSAPTQTGLCVARFEDK